MGIELKKIWMDGRFVDWDKAQVHILTHALHYGTGIFEGIRCYKTDLGPAIFRLQDHMKRLYSGAKTYTFEIPYSVDHLCKVTKQLVVENKVDHCYIRPIVYLGYSRIGLNMEGIPVKVAIAPANFDHYFDPKTASKGLTCKVSSWRRIKTTILSPHVKATANYLNSVLAKLEAIQCGYNEAIMLNLEGHVCEGTGENLFIVKDGELLTPPLYDGALGGITRDSVIRIAKDSDIKVHERPILLDEVFTADEVFMTGTAAEIVHVVEVDKRVINNRKIGSITKLLRGKFYNAARGKDPKYHYWLDVVK